MADLRIDGNELVLHLSGTDCDEWIVGCADPETVAAGLGLPTSA